MNEDQQNKIDQMSKDIKALNDEIYKNNFSSVQDFSKYSRFNTKLKVPHYDTLPATCEVGEIAESGGKLRVCSALNTWSIVGSQS